MKLVCINCPMGCRMSVQVMDAQVCHVDGNQCNRGLQYAYQEATEPLRMITTLMKAINNEHPVSVKTSAPVPKRRYWEIIDEIRSTNVQAPIICGDVLIHNVCSTGVDILATQDIY